MSRVSGQTPRRSRPSPCDCVCAALRCGLWPCPAADKCGETRIASHPTPATACDYTSVLARPTLSVVFQEREKKKALFLGDGWCSSGDAADAACARRDLRQGGWEHHRAAMPCRGPRPSFHLLGLRRVFKSCCGIPHIAIIICPYMHGTLLQYHVASGYLITLVWARAATRPSACICQDSGDFSRP